MCKLCEGRYADFLKQFVDVTTSSRSVILVAFCGVNEEMK